MSKQTTPKAVILFLDSARGQFIPRDFAQSIKRDAVEGVAARELDALAEENSNESPDYWELWANVLRNAKIKHEGYVYALHHDGDLWLLQYDLMTEEEREAFGFED